MDENENKYYPDYKENFKDIINKYEFSSNSADKKKTYIYQEPSQMLLRNFISKNTIYENVLLYHGLGTGKSCQSITIAEGFKEYVNNMGKKIVILVKNKNIKRNFINELLSKCTDDEYLTDQERQLYFSVSKTTQLSDEKRDIINKVNRLINKSYVFLTYGTFVNRTLGMKEMDYQVSGDGKRKVVKDEIKNLNNTVIVVDEAHNITNNDVYIALHQVLSKSYNFRLVLLTATPIYDNPKEIFEISNLLNVNNEEYQLPIRKDLFKPLPESNDILLVKDQSKFINNKVLKGGIIKITDSGLNMLNKTLYGKVSYLKENVETNPKKIDMGSELIADREGTINVVYCKMSKYQYNVYLQALRLDIKSSSQFDLSTAIQNIESVEALQEVTSTSKTSSLYKNSSDASTMVYPENTFGKIGFLSSFSKTNRTYTINDKSVLTDKLQQYSCKLYELLKNIKSNPGNVFIYSNYVSFGGTSLIKLILLNNGYKEFSLRDIRDINIKDISSLSKESNKFIMFDESTNVEVRDKLRRIFNSKENANGELIKIIIGSPIISEGITLKNVRQVHILEPSWNMSRINQIVGRAVRNYSHQNLDEKDRYVKIFKYISVYSPDEKDQNGNGNGNGNVTRFFIDKEKYILSEEKDRSNKTIERLLKTISFDCELMKSRNIKNLTDKNKNTAECDYMECLYECKVKKPDTDKIDKSTYNLYINFFEKYDIKYVTDEIKELFKTYFIWHIDDIMNTIKEKEQFISDETIYNCLIYITENKIPFLDIYNRDGFIIQKGPYFIFNNSEIDINSSIYTKMLDFSVDKNKYNLEEYSKLKLGINIFKEIEKKPKKVVFVEKLSEEDSEYNMDIINNNKLFGTFRERGTKEEPFGQKDETFRIVDLRKDKSDKSEDKRKIVSGMWVGSFTKSKLIDITKYLKIPEPPRLSFIKHDKEQLGKIIEKFLTENNLVLR